MFEKLACDIYNAAIIKLATYDFNRGPYGKENAELILKEYPKTLKYIENLRSDPKTDPRMLKFEEDNLPYLTKLHEDAQAYLASLK